MDDHLPSDLPENVKGTDPPAADDALESASGSVGASSPRNTGPSGEPSGATVERQVPANESSGSGPSGPHGNEETGNQTAADARRLAIPLALLAIAAIAAIAVGVTQRKTVDSANSTITATSTSVVSPAPTAGGTSTVRIPAGAAPTSRGTAAASGPASCGAWPDSYLTTPAATAETGVYLWAANGWHLRAMSTDGTKPVGGIIVAASDVRPEWVKLTDPANGSVAVQGNTVAFRFETGSTAAGIDFLLPCPIREFSVQLQGADRKPWPTEGIFIGRTHKATSNPISVKKQG